MLIRLRLCAFSLASSTHPPIRLRIDDELMASLDGLNAVAHAGSAPSNPGQSQDPQSAQDPSRRKRKRILHACEACRQCKSRCDGARPACQLCSQNGTSCQYSDSGQRPRNASPERRTVAALEQRLQQMEGVLRALVATQANTTPTLFPPSNGPASSHSIAVPPLPALGACPTATAPTTFDPVLHPSSGSADPQDSVDGMASITFSDETSSGAFGRRVLLPHLMNHLTQRCLRSHFQLCLLGKHLERPSHRLYNR